jgi:hypothetical protein
LAALSQAVNSLLFGVSVVAAILALLSLLRVTVFILEISGDAFSTTQLRKLFLVLCNQKLKYVFTVLAGKESDNVDSAVDWSVACGRRYTTTH